jgi:16S rRNA (guanine1207-N2)-methyltransferase
MTPDAPPLRIAEARALDAARTVAAERILSTTLGRAQAAAALAAQRPACRVTCWLLDDHARRLAIAASGRLDNLALELSADAPPGAVDLAVVPLSTRGEAELSRDLLQSAWQRLAVGGTLVTAVDNPRDRWLRAQLAAWFDAIRPLPQHDATVYLARKDEAPRKVKGFRCEFAFRDRGRLLRAVSRPGVFAHRRVDPGARRLLEAAEPRDGMRVLEIGCGSGVVAIGLAARDPALAVHAVDSHARAVECTRAGAELNALANLTVELNSTGDYGLRDAFDLAVLNPPYYGDFVIARRFLDAARSALQPGGEVLVVTKTPEWFREALEAEWTAVRVWDNKGYWLAQARKVGPPGG